MSNTLSLRRQQRFPRCTLQRFNLSLSLLLLFLFASTRSSLSTTICAIQYCDGVVIGADSRSTSGGMVMNKEVSKIRRLAARSALAGAGVSAVCSHVSSQVSLDLARMEMRESLAGEREGGNEEELTATSTSSTRVLHALRRALNAVFLRNEKFNANLESVFICGCVSREGPSLFLVHSDGAHESIPFGAFGSGSCALKCHFTM